MKANTKPGWTRFALGPKLAFVAAIGLTAAGATPALAESAGLIAPVAPMVAAVAPGALVSASTNGIASASVPEPIYETIGSGMASYYGKELAGNRTASGERFNPSDLTAAHRTLPLGSHVRVTNAKTGDSVIVRINDRGPFHGNRLIDLSEAAAREIGIRAAGSGMVQVAIAAD